MSDRSHPTQPPHECPSGKRNRYFRSKLMTSGDFRLEQRYGISRRRLVNRAMFGKGVVYGLGAETATNGRLEVDAGLAFDCFGRELALTTTTCFAAEEALYRQGWSKKDIERIDVSVPWVALLHYAERSIGPVRIPDPCGGDSGEWNHLCETAVLRLMKASDYGKPAENDGPCGTCRMDATFDPTKRPPKRGPADMLCCWVETAQVAADPPPLSLCPGGLAVDPGEGVPIATVWFVRRDNCLVFASSEDGAVRPLTLRTPLLLDLVRGKDLTGIALISWQAWHRQLDWENPVLLTELQQKFHDQGRDQPVRTDFEIRFSRPVLVQSLRIDTVTFTVGDTDKTTGWERQLRAPITRLEPVGKQGDGPAETATGMRILVDYDWWRDEIQNRPSVFNDDRPSLVEIAIRGDLIRDCHGQAIDANGTGVPGGTFTSAFLVGRNPGRTRAATQPRQGE